MVTPSPTFLLEAAVPIHCRAVHPQGARHDHASVLSFFQANGFLVSSLSQYDSQAVPSLRDFPTAEPAAGVLIPSSVKEKAG